MIFVAQNPIGAKPGDTVRVRTDSKSVLLGAAILYMLPLALFLIGYAVADAWQMGIWGGLLGFAFGVLAAVFYDRKVARKKKPQYTIIGY